MSLRPLHNALRRAMGRPEFGGLEIEDLPAMLDMDAPVLLEIGAHDGAHTRQFARTFPKGAIHAFEPDPRALEKLSAAVRNDNVTLHNLAIGAQDGTATFHQSNSAEGATGESHDASGSLRAPKLHLETFDTVTFDTTVEVQVRSLDSWCREMGVTKIDFIWADVQGAERDLIHGAASMLGNTRYIYTEYNNRELYEGQWTLDQITAALPQHRLVRQWRNDVLFEHTSWTADQVTQRSAADATGNPR